VRWLSPEATGLNHVFVGFTVQLGAIFAIHRYQHTGQSKQYTEKNRLRLRERFFFFCSPGPGCPLLSGAILKGSWLFNRVACLMFFDLVT
jgi:hypothetical protein